MLCRRLGKFARKDPSEDPNEKCRNKRQKVYKEDPQQQEQEGSLKTTSSKPTMQACIHLRIAALSVATSGAGWRDIVIDISCLATQPGTVRLSCRVIIDTIVGIKGQ